MCTPLGRRLRHRWWLRCVATVTKECPTAASESEPHSQVLSALLLEAILEAHVTQ